jgi:hypothetical protein
MTKRRNADVGSGPGQFYSVAELFKTKPSTISPDLPQEDTSRPVDFIDVLDGLTRPTDFTPKSLRIGAEEDPIAGVPHGVPLAIVSRCFLTFFLGGRIV